MRRVLSAIIALLMCIGASAVEFSPYVLRYLSAYYNKSQVSKELLNFSTDCVFATNSKDKKIAKIQAAYEQICQKYPAEKPLAMCYYGAMQLRAKSELTNKEEGFKQLQEGMQQLSDIPERLRAELHALTGCCYLQGVGTPKDEGKALAEYQKACEADASPFYGQLGFLYLLGIGTQADEEMAYQYIRQAYENAKTNSERMLVAADLYEKACAIIMHQNPAIDSVAKAEYLEGLRCMMDAEKNEQMTECFKKAAERGLPAAMYELGHFSTELQAFFSTKEQRKEQEIWLQKAADQSYCPAVFLQGMNIFGKGTTFVAEEHMNQAKAYKYFSRLAEMDYDPAVTMVQVYETNGYAKTANLLGDILKGALSVASMASSIKHNGLATGLTSQMNGPGKGLQKKFVRIDKFLDALQVANSLRKSEP